MRADKKKPKGESEESGWVYKPSVANANADAERQGEANRDHAVPEDGAVEWSASEFVAHEKGAGWYLLLALVAVVVAAGVYLATRDMFSIVIIVVMAVIFGVAGAHKPRVVDYRLDERGLTAGKKFYPYNNYKSFVMPDDGPFVSVMFIPLRRFDLPTGAYLPPENQQEVLDLLSEHLPLERGEPRLFDTIMRRLRF